MTLKTDVDQLAADSQLMHDIVHGGPSDAVSTEGGAVASAANAINTLRLANPRGAWLTATAYALKDQVNDSANAFGNGAGVLYVCTLAHTSGVAATDLAAGKWAIHQGATLEDLADTTDATKNSALVGYKSPSTGASVRNVAKKLDDTAHLFDFIVPAQHANILAATSTFDATVDFQAAVDAESKLLLPHGLINIDGSITLPKTFMADGAGAYQNALGRDTRIKFNGTSGWALDYPNSDALDSEFKGDWSFSHLKIIAGSISGDINGGCIKIGNSDTGSFASYNTCGRIALRNCEIITGSLKGVGLYLIKVFDPQIEANVFAGANYGVWGYGSDISQIGKTNRFNANGTHVRWTVSGSYSGSLDLDHNDMLASTYVAVWLEGCIAPALTKNYIENVAAGTALATAQTGTVAQNDLDTTLTGTGTTFLAQLAQTAFGGDRRRVLIKVGDEYRQVLSTASDTSATLDAPFPYSFTGQAWSICYGVGIIASSCTNIKQEANRVDITATSGAVPRAYYFSSQADINDVGGENSDQGRIVFADNAINADLYNVRGARMQPNIRLDQPGYFDLYPGAAGHNNIRSQHFIDGWKKHNPVLVYDHRYFFQDAVAGGLLSQGGASGELSVFLAVVGNISTKIPSEFLNVPCVLRWRMKSIGGASTNDFYHAAASQGTDTLLVSDTINTAYTDGAWRGVIATTAEPYLTMVRSVNLHKVEYISIERVSTPVGALADSVAATVADLKTDFNLLLQRFRDAGYLEP